MIVQGEDHFVTLDQGYVHVKNQNSHIKIIFCVEPPWGGRLKVCLNDQGHMTKIAAMHIYENNHKSFSFKPNRWDRFQ